MENNRKVTVGRYTEFAVFDRSDFDKKMREGYSFNQYMLDEKNHTFRIALGPNQAVRNRFQVYVYHVDGKEYYKVNPIAVSWDIRASRKGNPVGVSYNPLNPYDAVIDKSVKITNYKVADQYNDGVKATAKEVPVFIAFILSLFSLVIAFTTFGWTLSVAAFIILACYKKESKLRTPTIVLSIIGIVISVVMLAVYIALFLGLFPA